MNCADMFIRTLGLQSCMTKCSAVCILKQKFASGNSLLFIDSLLTISIDVHIRAAWNLSDNDVHFTVLVYWPVYMLLIESVYYTDVFINVFQVFKSSFLS